MEIDSKTAIPSFIKSIQNILFQQSEVFISQIFNPGVLKEMYILLAHSLFKNKFEVWGVLGSGSLFLGSVLKKGNKFSEVFRSLVFLLLEAICNGSAFVKMA